MKMHIVHVGGWGMGNNGYNVIRGLKPNGSSSFCPTMPETQISRVPLTANVTGNFSRKSARRSSLPSSRLMVVKKTKRMGMVSPVWSRKTLVATMLPNQRRHLGIAFILNGFKS